MALRFVGALILAGATGLGFAADHPVGWRNDGSGTYPNADPPLEWSRDTNVVWATPLPDWSNSQPVPAGDRLFLAAEPSTLVCVDATDGTVLWKRTNTNEDAAGPDEWARAKPELEQAATLRDQKDKLDSQLRQLRDASPEAETTKLEQQIADLDEKLAALPLAMKYQPFHTHQDMNGYTTATPVTDGQHVWAVFGNAVVACYDRDGKRRWIRRLPDRPHAMFGHSSSPLLVKDRLILPIEDTVALDAKTGQELWRTKYGQSWGSPIHVTVGGEDLIALANGRFLRATDGEVVGRAPYNLADPSPIREGRRIYYIQSRGGAIELPEDVGAKLQLERLWKTAPKGRKFYASPVIRDGLIYTVAANAVLNVIDAADGTVVNQQRLDLGGGTIYPSIVLAGDHLFVTSDNGTTAVLTLGREPEVVATNSLGERLLSTPVFDGRRMYLRTRRHLWCLGE